MQYSFDERADKGVKVFDLTTDGVQNLKDVPLQSGKRLIRLEADGVALAEELLSQYPDALVEMKLMLSSPLTSGDTVRLAQHKNLVSLLTEIHSDETLQFQSRKGLSDEALFDAFYKAAYNAEPNPELKTLFLETLENI